MNVESINITADHHDVQRDSIMNSVDRYRHEWYELIASLNDYEAIQVLGFNGDLKVSKFRSIYWALLVRVLNCDHTSWSEQRLQQRNRYDKLKQEFARNPHIEEALNDDPLSQSKQSVWNQYFSDQELVSVIKQDVVRTFPGVDFFRKQLIQDAMTNILFCYAREHPYMSYRQGMHEILAPILFVLYGDHQALLHFKELNRTIDILLMDVLNPEFQEADSYTLFARVMSSIESYYRISNLVQNENGYFCVQTEQTFSNSLTTEVEVIGQLNSIRDKILAKEDLHLHNYLLKLDIPLHIFGIRWLRLLFGREFPLLDLLVLWDAIFADSDRFDLPNYILVAMLIRIRDRLLCNDYTTCLTYLMRYPTNVDISLILRHALHMQYPKRFDRPPNAFVYFTMNSDASQPVLPPSQRNNSSTGIATTNKVPMNPNVMHLKAEIPPESSRQSTSFSSEVRFQQQITDVQYQNAWDSAVRARLKATPESDKVIIDGYSENSPELLRLELKNAQTIIDISKSKLQAYLNIIKKNLARNPPEELCQAVDGIEELCSFLDVKFIFPYNSRSQQIDQALEADENRQFKSVKPRVKRNSIQMTNGNASSSNSQPIETGVEDIAGEEEDDDESDIDASIVVSGATAYERPDNGFMGSTRRILGNRREVELIPIMTDEKLVLDQRPSTQGVPSIDPIGYRDD